MVGAENYAGLDFSVFTSRKEFRQSSHVAVGKRLVRIEEAAEDAKMIPDQWKRFVTGGEFDLRENYSRTQKANFTGNMVRQEANYGSLPTIEKVALRQGADTVPPWHMERRGMMIEVGAATIVHDPAEVSHENGMFLFIDSCNSKRPAPTATGRSSGTRCPRSASSRARLSYFYAQPG